MHKMENHIMLLLMFEKKTQTSCMNGANICYSIYTLCVVLYGIRSSSGVSNLHHHHHHIYTFARICSSSNSIIVELRMDIPKLVRIVCTTPNKLC